MWRRSLGARIVALALPLALLPLGLIGGVAYWYVERTLEVESEAGQLDLARGLGAQAREYLTRARDATRALAMSPVVGDWLAQDQLAGDARERVRQAMGEVARGSGMSGRLAVVDRVGHERCAEPDHRLEPAPRRASVPPFFFEVISRGELQYPVESQSGWSRTRFAHDVTRDGRFLGLVSLELDLEPVEVLLGRAAAERQAEFILFDDRGLAIARSSRRPDAIDWPGLAAEATAAAALGRRSLPVAAGMTGVLTPVDEYIGFLDPRTGERWSLLMAVPHQATVTRLAEVRRWAWVLAVTCLVLGGLGSLLVSRSVTRPVQQLVKGIDRVAAGDFDTRVAAGNPDEMGHLIAGFNAMAESLGRYRSDLVRAEQHAALGRVASAVAHEVRNPLHAIRSCADLLRLKRPDDPVAARHADIIAAEADSLNRFVTDFLRLARMPAPSMRSVDIGILLRERAELHEAEAAERGVAIAVDVADGVPPLWADPQQIALVLENLVDNACEAMPDGGSLSLGARPERDGVTITVRDSGAGMAPVVAGRVFEMFFTTRPGGVGLGLGTCRRIVDQHGGTITFTSAPGEGTVFSVWLPAREERIT
ncbi:MAG: ATP-binding protein [Acidobacteriota bacterium]